MVCEEENLFSGKVVGVINCDVVGSEEVGCGEIGDFYVVEGLDGGGFEVGFEKCEYIEEVLLKFFFGVFGLGGNVLGVYGG